jgi:hypothetical protein
VPRDWPAWIGIACGFAVADRQDLEFTYSLIDRIFRLSLGELADFSGAKYDGDFSLSLADAQRSGAGGAPIRVRIGMRCGFGGGGRSSAIF